MMPDNQTKGRLKMDNRDRDEIDRSEGPTRIRDEDREASRGRQDRSSDAEFGKKIGESEELEPDSREGGMRGSQEDH